MPSNGDVGKISGKQKREPQRGYDISKRLNLNSDGPVMQDEYILLGRAALPTIDVPDTR